MINLTSTSTNYNHNSMTNNNLTRDVVMNAEEDKRRIEYEKHMRDMMRKYQESLVAQMEESKLNRKNVVAIGCKSLEDLMGGGDCPG